MAEASNGLEQLHVEKDEHAIGFVSFAYTGGVTRSPTRAWPATCATPAPASTQGVRNFWMVTKGAAKGEAAKFITWVTSGNAITKTIINSSWIAVH